MKQNNFSRKYLICTFALFCSGMSVIAASIEEATAKLPPPQVSELASEAYSTLANLPQVGIDQSKEKLKKLIVSAEKLQLEDDGWKVQLSIALKEAIAHGLIYEMYRSEAIRLQVNSPEQQVLIPFTKTIFLELWNANLPNESQVLNRTRRGDDIIVKQLSVKDINNKAILNGGEVSKEMKDRFLKLETQANSYGLIGKKMSPDELFVQSLVMIQTMRDLDIIVRLYKKSGLLKDWGAFRTAIDATIKNPSKKRLGDEDQEGSLKILSTFGKYCSQNNDAYIMQQSMLLGSYMTNTKHLPAQIQSYLNQNKKQKSKH